MIEHKQRSITKLAVMIFIIAAGVYAFVSVYNPKSNPPVLSTESEEPASLKGEQKAQPSDIVRLRRTWGPILTSWYGEKAPDFTLTDIEGKGHKLSDYRGRNVLLTFWATWCIPCLTEIPSLMSLRNMMGEDKLVILAISNEPPDRVKNFAAARKLNYTVISHNTLQMGRPYNQIMGVPTSFFINPEGKIKIIAEGTMPFNDIRAILETN